MRLQFTSDDELRTIGHESTNLYLILGEDRGLAEKYTVASL